MRPEDSIDVKTLLDHVTDAMRPIAGSAGRRFDMTVREEPLVVIGDRDELTQVFQNLIDNAIKYGADGENIEVVVGPGRRDLGTGGFALVRVRDHGQGIPVEHLPRLTERFYRVDAVTSRAKGGTGLGLAIVKHILNRHRGRLTVESNLGAGAEFTVHLPLAHESNDDSP